MPIGARDEKPLAGGADERGAGPLRPGDPPCGAARCAHTGRASAATIVAIVAKRLMPEILRLFEYARRTKRHTRNQTTKTSPEIRPENSPGATPGSAL
jgi:hypothetical protein